MFCKLKMLMTTILVKGRPEVSIRIWLPQNRKTVFTVTSVKGTLKQNMNTYGKLPGVYIR